MLMFFPQVHACISCWANHAENTSWYTMLKYSSPSVVHPFFEYFNSQMVVVPSQLWRPLFSPRVSGAVVAQGPQKQCWKLAPQPAVPETRGLKSGSHSLDGTHF